MLLEFFSGNPNTKDGEGYGIRSFEVDAVSGPTQQTEPELAKLWEALNGREPIEASKARWELIAAGTKGADYVRRMAEAAKIGDPKAAAAREKAIAATIAQWIVHLDAEEFKSRMEARVVLKKLGADAIPALEKEAKKTKSAGVRVALLSVIKSLNAKQQAAGGAEAHKRLVDSRVAHILRLFDISNSGRKLSASTSWHPIGSLDDGFVPLKMTGHSAPRFEWRTKELQPDHWVQYEFPNAKTFDSATVFWFEDSGWEKGAKLPESWSLVYKAGDVWKPVKTRGDYGITYGEFDRVEFEPVETTAIRLKSRAQKGHFAGLMEFRLGETEPKKNGLPVPEAGPLEIE